MSPLKVEKFTDPTRFDSGNSKFDFKFCPTVHK
jgi:hypothetical protein